MVWLIGLGLLAGGNAYAERELQKFEKEAAVEIASLLQGESKKVSVNATLNGPFGALFSDIKQATISASQFEAQGLPLFVEPELKKSGMLRRLNLQLTDFNLGKLRIESLKTSIPDCAFDRDLALKKRIMRLSKSGVGTGSVRISAQSLSDYIPTKVREIKRCVVKLEKNKVWVEGYGEFLIAKTNFLIVADLGIENGTKLNMQNARISFGWQKADPESARILLDLVNPVVDLENELKILDAFRIEEVKISDGILECLGISEIPTRPKAEK